MALGSQLRSDRPRQARRQTSVCVTARWPQAAAGKPPNHSQERYQRWVSIYTSGKETIMSNIDDQISQTRERLRDLQAKARKLERRDDTRRKILYGAAVLKLAEELEGDKRKRLYARLHDHISREKDRKFLGLQSDAQDQQ
ncbi:MAG: hypothetical protein ACU0A8_05715 [Limimaricola soesokkakensis]|uniref:hypothetical protein n=1 Tax=Limimaricola soesokkakensis TaxID=1343159 RepID=UPI004059942F